jgi:hypothetical protein
VYAGHAAIALALKARRPEIPIIPLALACYGPDWIDALLMIPHPREGMAPYSHSLPAVAIGAAIAGALYSAFAKRPGGLMLIVGWLSHWPADYLTGVKPLFGTETRAGLDLYHLPWADPVLESVLIVIACLLYAWSQPEWRRSWRTVAVLATALIVLQLGFISSVGRLDGLPWNPAPFGYR